VNIDANEKLASKAAKNKAPCGALGQ